MVPDLKLSGSWFALGRNSRPRPNAPVVEEPLGRVELAVWVSLFGNTTALPLQQLLIDWRLNQAR